MLKLYIALAVFTCAASTFVNAQTLRRQVSIASGSQVEIINRYGRVEVSAAVSAAEGGSSFVLTGASESSISNSEITSKVSGSKMQIEVVPTDTKKRIDIVLAVPERTRLTVETTTGEVLVTGDLESVDVTTTTGTIAADVPTNDIRYELNWNSAHPRVMSDFKIEDIKERSAGRFQIKGKYPTKEDVAAAKGDEPDVVEPEAAEPEDKKARRKRRKELSKGTVDLKLTTGRGIILLNVPPNEVASDLRERELTKAAKAIIRSGDSILTDAIRRAAPKFFIDYARTLPPVKRVPRMSEIDPAGSIVSPLKVAAVRVSDINNRSIAGLTAADFEVTEKGEKREVLSVTGSRAAFNLVLLLDVSGSVDNYVDFIRKAARSFVMTADPHDRISLIAFNDDVNVLSTFTTDRGKLSESLDTFDAGGSTAYYDALAYTLSDTLRPMRGERTAIVVLTDGDDNRSFLSFDSLLGSIQESGALIYPLYVPSSLIAASASNDPNASVDSLRSRYMSLTSKADAEGAELAKVSGGVYYPITQISQIQKAYDDIVLQLRSSYLITFRSTLPDALGAKGFTQSTHPCKAR